MVSDQNTATSEVMELGKLFLRADTNVELLNCRWHAWQHTFSPVQHAMNLAFRQIPLLESFIANPAIHCASSADPALLGGPFVDLPVSKVPEVSALLDITRERCGHLIELAKSFRELFSLLDNSGKGYSLDAVYDKLPLPLRGVVELAYDIRNTPVVKIREELLQRDPYYKSPFWEIALSKTVDTARNFFINTPKMPEGDDLIVPIDFDNRGVDLLSRARLEPVSLVELSVELGLDGATQRLLPFFTDVPPIRIAPRYNGDGVRVRYFGHACVLVQTATTGVLIDPRFAFERNEDLATLTFYDLPDFVDHVFISHSHQDHFCPETLTQLRGRVGRFLVPRNNRGSLCDPSMKLTLADLGFDNVDMLDDLQQIEIPGGHIVSIPFPGEHCGLDVQSKHCALIVVNGIRILLLVDSDAVDLALYTRLKKHIGKVDALFIGMECNGAPLTWLYGPLLSKTVLRRDDESRRGNGSNSDRAWRVIQELGCTNIYVYAMGMEPWNNHLLGLEYAADSVQIKESDDLIERCRSAGLHAERLKGCREFLFDRPSEVPANAADSILERM
jgi:L-ascorbate metabolism protein UlaG (beta-lactamase superfamily)